MDSQKRPPLQEAPFSETFLAVACRLRPLQGLVEELEAEVAILHIPDPEGPQYSMFFVFFFFLSGGVCMFGRVSIGFGGSAM